MGFVPYILFLHALRRRRAAPLVVLELPNCSRSHYQDVIPSVPSFRAALETLLRREFGVTRSGESRPPLGRCLHRALFTPGCEQASTCCSATLSAPTTARW